MKKRLVLVILLLAFPVFAQYKMPPKEIADVVDAPPPPIMTLSGDGRWILIQNVPPLLTIEDLSRPELKLAGIRFDPERHEESRGRKTPASTYEDMIKDESDAALFEYHMQSALMRVPLDGEPQPIGAAAMIVRDAPSPDGRFLLVESIHRPFSYRVPFGRFPRRIEVWSAAGQLVKQIADLPLADRVATDFDAVPVGPRDAEWRGDKPATLAWVEAQDEGNPRKEAAVRDRVVTLAEPFTGAPATLADLPMRYDGVAWGTDDVALVEARRWKD